MASQPRMVKVLLALIVSMTSGAAVLIALGNNAPSAGPFSLAAYRQLDSIESSIVSRSPLQPNRWNCIEVYYSGSKAGNIPQLASLEGTSQPEELNCHFCLCNGLGGDDGQILATERWLMQWSCSQNQTWFGSPQTIRVCVVSDGQATPPTDCQKRRVVSLIDTLCKKFNIPGSSVYLPPNWQ